MFRRVRRHEGRPGLSRHRVAARNARIRVRVPLAFPPQADAEVGGDHVGQSANRTENDRVVLTVVQVGESPIRLLADDRHVLLHDLVAREGTEVEEEVGGELEDVAGGEVHRPGGLGDVLVDRIERGRRIHLHLAIVRLEAEAPGGRRERREADAASDGVARLLLPVGPDEGVAAEGRLVHVDLLLERLEFAVGGLGLGDHRHVEREVVRLATVGCTAPPAPAERRDEAGLYHLDAARVTGLGGVVQQLRGAAEGHGLVLVRRADVERHVIALVDGHVVRVIVPRSERREASRLGDAFDDVVEGPGHVGAGGEGLSVRAGSSQHRSKRELRCDEGFLAVGTHGNGLLAGVVRVSPLL